MAATEQTASNLTPLQSALLAAHHSGGSVSEAAIIAYWLDGQAAIARDHHIGWLIAAYDEMAPHIEALRAITTKQAA